VRVKAPRPPAVSVRSDDRGSMPMSGAAAAMLVEHLFTPGQQELPGIEYAVEYKLAEGRAGGDIVDVYEFDNESVAFSVADISGKGVQAAVHAAMVKYGLRAYASVGFVAEKVLQALDRLYLENNAYEQRESFATAFFGHVDKERKTMIYASAAHDCVVMARPGERPSTLEVTAPLIGVFEDQQELFHQRIVNIEPGCVLVAVTDGVTEARRLGQELFGMQRLCDIVDRARHQSMAELARLIVEQSVAFCGDRAHDDMAVLAARFS